MNALCPVWVLVNEAKWLDWAELLIVRISHFELWGW